MNAYNNGVATRQFITTKTGNAAGAVKSTFHALSAFCQGFAQGAAPIVKATKAKKLVSK